MSEVKKEKSFEEMLKRLEEIVHALDNAQTPLDDALKYFEEGAGLVRACTEKLDEAQQKVTLLTVSDGKVSESDFKGEKA